MTTFYCIDKDAKAVLSSGPLPSTWGTISGIDVLDDIHRKDMTWAGYPTHAFLTQSEALTLGITQEQLDTANAFYRKSIVPNAITMRQARLTFLSAGILPRLESAINNIEEENARSVAQIEWQFGEFVYRNNSPITSLIANVLGFTELQIDDMFIEGMYR
jgi:hypothetical protein